MSNAKDATDESRDELWDANGVARYLKVSRSWVYQHAESGELPCLHVGSLVRFDPDAVRAYARCDTKPSKVLPFSASPSRKDG